MKNTMYSIFYIIILLFCISISSYFFIQLDKKRMEYNNQLNEYFQLKKEFDTTTQYNKIIIAKKMRTIEENFK